jgi:hypothetical protein
VRMSQRCWPQSKASNSCSSFYGGSKASGPPVCAPKARFVGRVNQGPVYVSQVNRKRSIFGQSFGSDLSTILRSVRRAEGRQPSGTGFSGGLPVDCRPKVGEGPEAWQGWYPVRPGLAHVLRHEDASKRAFRTEKADLASKPIAGLSLVFSAGLLRACRNVQQVGPEFHR